MWRQPAAENGEHIQDNSLCSLKGGRRPYLKVQIQIQIQILKSANTNTYTKQATLATNTYIQMQEDSLEAMGEMHYKSVWNAVKC